MWCRVQEVVNDMDSVEQRSWGRLADWMKQRYHGECSAVSALHKLASEAAFAGQPLPFQLDLQVHTTPTPNTPTLAMVPFPLPFLYLTELLNLFPLMTSPSLSWRCANDSC